MVISDVNQITYNGDGITTAWPFTFQIIEATDIKLMLTDADGLETDITSDYYVDVENATVYYPGYAPGSEPPEADQPAKVQTGQKLTLYRRLPLTQEADLGGKWPFNVIEKGLDKLTMLMQDVYDWAERNVIGYKNGGWDARNFPIHNVGGPADVTDAATKDYVDKILSGIIASGDGRVVPFDNVSQMRDGDLVAGQIATTLGYYDINDGGNGTYAIRSAVPGDTDDGGSIIILDNGNVAELIADNVNVKQFGAKGDGATDDATAFSNSFAYAVGKNLSVPVGSYVINTNLFATGVKEVSDEGTYTNIKPVYPVKELIFETNDLVTVETSISFDSGFTSTQGMCYNTKTGKLIVSEKQDTDANPTHTQKLLVVDPANSYNVDATYTYTELKHCNSMTYCPDDNKIYVESFIVSGGASDFKIIVLDGDTMAIVDTIDLTDLPHNVALSYDQKCKLFVLGGSNKLHIYDKSFNFIKSVTVDDDGLSANGLIALDGQVVLFKIGSIEIFDLFGNLNKRIQSSGNMEAEDICWDGADTFYINYNILAKIVLAKYNAKNIAYYQTAKTNGEALQKFEDVAASKINYNGVAYIDNTNLLNYGVLPIPIAIVRSFYMPGYIRQIAIGTGDDKHKLYTREWDSSWSSWRRIDAGLTESGSFTPDIASGSYTDTAVTFTVPFTTTPVIMVSMATSGTSIDYAQVTAFLKDTSKTGFTVRAFNGGASSRSPQIRWFAIER